MTQHRVEDIRELIVVIDGILTWHDLTPESRQQLKVFRAELEQELRYLLQEELDTPQAA